MIDAIKQVTGDSNDVFVIDFYANWCNPCKKLDISLKNIRKDFKDVKFKKINVEIESELSNLFDVRSIPTLLFIKNNKIEERLVGAINEDLLTETIDKLI